MTTWPEDDLANRLIRALDLAERVVTEFGTTGYVDARVPALSFGPEKVIAEAAMLVYAASGACGRADVGRRVDAVARQLAPHVRSRRALADIALQPGRAFKHAVPHVLVTSLGHADDGFDSYFRSQCAVALGLAGDLPPSARLERHWVTSQWERVWRPAAADDVRGTFVERPIDVLSESREEAYSVTHLLFYLTDFGHQPPPRLPRSVGTILGELEGLLLRCLDREDYDLSGELLMAWPQLRAAWSPAASFAFRVLARVEDEVGVLPCGNVDLARMGELDAAERGRYARATAYHTAFVMGLLCAATARRTPTPPRTIAGPAYADSVCEGFLEHVDSDQGHWLGVFRECDISEKRALAPLLCNFAILQTLRRRDYAALHEVLVLARSAQLPEHHLRTRATEVLLALGDAMRLFGEVDQRV
jgi:hypothetical protein